MPVSTDIVASYFGPKEVVHRHLARGVSEPRALAFLMGGCSLLFVSSLPRLARQAYLDGTELDMLMGGSLLSTLFILPLILYALAWLVRGVFVALRRPLSGYGSRLALFWALLASSPLVLLNGLVAGFVGPGPGLQLVGALWLGVFLWFWLAGLRAASEDL